MHLRRALLSVVLGAILVTAAPAQGKSFVYTNDDARGANTVSGFRVADDGRLTPVPGSPFATGGEGIGQGSPGYMTSVVVAKRYLYVANKATLNISGFKIQPDGSLTLVESTLPMFGSGGADLVVTPNGKYLIAGPISYMDIFGIAVAVYKIKRNGKLRQVPGSPFPVEPIARAFDLRSMSVSPDGALLAGVSAYGEIYMMRIGARGALSTVSGSPFPGGERGNGYSVAFGRSGNRLYVSYGVAFPILDAFAVDSGGALSLLTGASIRFPGAGGNSTTLLPNLDGRFLYLSDPGSKGVNLFALDAQGIPTHVDGAPFPNPADEPFSPNNLRIEAAGRFLFAANYLSNSISVFSIASDGALTPVEGAPFATGVVGGGLQSIAVYPRS